MVPAVQFADFGFGTVVGAVIAGSIAIFLDQRRRKDERNSRFLEEKRLAYRNVVYALQRFDEMILWFSKFKPYFKKVEELDPEAQEVVQQAHEALQRGFAQMRSTYGQAIDFTLLSSKKVALAATRAVETLEQMASCVDMDEPCDVNIMQVIFEEQLNYVRYHARQDLGIDS